MNGRSSTRERAALTCVAVALVVLPFLRGGRDAAALPLALGLVVLALVFLLVDGQFGAAALRRWYANPVLWLLSVLVVATASWTVSVNRFATHTGVLELVALAAFVWAGSWLRERRRVLAATLLAVAAVVGLVGVVWFATGSDHTRIESVMGNANALGGLLVLPFILGFGLLRSAGRGRMRGFLVASLVVIAAALALSGSVTAIGPVIIGLFAWWLLAGRPRFRTVLAASAAAVVVAAALLSIPAVRTKALWGAEGRQISYKQRAAFLSATWQMFRANPLLGTGFNTWGVVQPKYQTTPLEKPLYAHSWIAQTVAETGIVGGLALLGFFLTFLAALRTALRRSDEPRFDRAVAAGLIAAAFNGSIDFSWNFLAVSVPVALFAGSAMTPRGDRAAAAATLPSRLQRAARAIGIVAVFLAALAALALFYGRSLQTTAGQRLRDGETDAAKELFAQSLVAATDPNIRRDLANLLFHTETGDDALRNAREIAERAVREDPFDGRAHHLLALIFLKQDDVVAAEREFRSALEVDPINNPLFALDLASVLGGQGRWDEVTALLTGYLGRYQDNRPYGLNPDLPAELAEMHRFLARAALSKNDTATAADHLRQAQKEDPSVQLTEEEQALLN